MSAYNKRSPKPLYQGPNRDYQLHTLGWHSFQDLAITVLGAALGQNIETFAPTNDGGRDGCYCGEWNPISGGVSGTATAQVKFSALPNASLTKSDISEELDKAKYLAARGLAKNYVLITNCGYTARTQDKIREAFLAITGIDSFQMHGKHWLTTTINGNHRLRMLVPKVYGIGDLQALFNERRREQAQAILDYLGQDLSTFVITAAYRDAVKSLEDHRIVVLLGKPAAGKTTIASALAIAAIDRWGCEPMRVSSGSDFKEAWTVGERQLFWIDDAFGATQYQRQQTDDWVQSFPYFITALNSGSRIIMTSRTYIFEEAIKNMKASAFPALREQQVQIKVEEYSPKERVEILYNHLRFGDQDQGLKTWLRTSGVLPNIALNPRFAPVVARRIANRQYTRKLEWTEESVINFVEYQTQVVLDALEALDEASYGALSLVFMNGGRLPSPVDLTARETVALSRLGTSPADVLAAMQALRGTFLRFAPEKGHLTWRFDHPSIGDALAIIFGRDAEKLDIYLSGAKIELILQEVTCAGSDTISAPVVVPESRYSLLIDRLTEVQDPGTVVSFLNDRADRALLSRSLVVFANIKKRLILFSPYFYSAESKLLSRLSKLRLLDDASRKAAIVQISEHSCNQLDAAFLDGSDILTSEERSTILASVRDSLVNVEDVVDDLEQNWTAPEDPYDYFQDLNESLERIRNEYADDPEVDRLIDAGLQLIEDAIERLSENMPEEVDDDRDDRDPPDRDDNSEQPSERDPFEDVDAPI